MIFERIFREFASHGLRYTVIGGIAVNLHGYNRLTGDLDILLSLTDENIHKFVTIAKRLGLVPRLPVALDDFANHELRQSWVTEKNMMVFSVYSPDKPLEHIDVKIDTPETIESLIDNSDILDAGDLQISVVSLSDLIQLKQESGRERDLVDVRALQRIRKLDEDENR